MKKMLNKIRNSKGFTLMEMIVVIAIIGILIAIIVPNVARVIGQAQNTATEAAARSIFTSAQTWSVNAFTEGLELAPAATQGAADALADITIDAATPTTVPVRMVTLDANTNGSAVFVNGEPLIGTGDAYLPANTLRGGQRAYIYITTDYTVQGVILVDAENNVIATNGTVPFAATQNGATTADGRAFN